MRRATSITLLAFAVVLSVAGFASAVTINSSTYTCINLGGDYDNPGNTNRDFYAYHLSSTGVVSGYTLSFYSNSSGQIYRYGYPALYSSGSFSTPFGATSYQLNQGPYTPDNTGTGTPVIYSPVMENASGTWSTRTTRAAATS